MSNPQTIAFEQYTEGGKRVVDYIVSRPEVLPVLKKLHEADWGWWLTFRGTEAELIAAGVARAEMFEIGKSVQRKYEDMFGDRCTVRRRGKKAWEVEYQLSKEIQDALPTDDEPQKSDWWTKHCSATETATAEILKRFARGTVRP
jgi:hypothetical protein